MFIKFVSQNNLYNHVNVPTRITSNSSKILDQFITNCTDIVHKVDVEDIVSTNDHCSIGIWLNFKPMIKKCFDRLVWGFKNCDFTQYKMTLSLADFSFCDHIVDIDTTVSLWTNTVYQIAKNNIPNKLVKIRPTDKPWFNGHLRRLL